MAQALNMGDEVHNRNAAATALFFKRLAPALLEADVPRADAAATLAFIAGNDHFFLNLSMAACKAMLDAAAGVPGSSMVTAMARNGVNFGVRLSGTGDAWFEAPANPVDGLYFPGYSIADAAADLGDSAITETAGVGGFAMAAAPAIVKFVGGTPTDAIHHSLRMRAITLGANPSFTLPALDFAAGGRRHRRAQGGRLRRAAGHQQRHRAPRGRRRADRRRRHHRADGVLHRGGEGAGAQRRRDRGDHR